MHRGVAAQRGGDRRGWGRQGEGRGGGGPGVGWGQMGVGGGLDNDGVALAATVVVRRAFPVNYAERGLAP
jgi:hypothetical protein